MCSIFRGMGIYQFKNLCEWGGLKFVLEFELMIPEIGGHALTEGSWLSVPAPRRAQIFFQVCLAAPSPSLYNPSRPSFSYIISYTIS